MAKRNSKNAAKEAAKRVAIYARRSKDDGNDVASIPDQIKDCKRYAALNGWGAVVRVQEERRSGVSGFDRRVFTELVRAAEAGEFEVLLTLDMSRFGRFDADERGYWVTRLRQAGVETRHVLDDDRLAGEAGPVMGAVIQTGNREHSVKTAYKVATAAVSTIERGFWPGGNVPFGYLTKRREGFDGVGRRDTRVVIDEEAAEIVREVFRLRIELSLGYSRIARQLNAAGHTTRSGRRWSGPTVKKILVNEAYKGDLVRGRSRRPKGGRSAPKFYTCTPAGPQKVSDLDEFPVVRVEGFFPPIIEQETWDKAQIVNDRLRQKYGSPALSGGVLWAASERRVVGHSREAAQRAGA